MMLRFKDWLHHDGVRLGLVLAALSGLRALFAAGVELCPDEAYYWTWSERLDFGYYDHGPLVAWLVRLGTALFGKSELGVRVGALLCSLVTAACLYQATKMLTSSRTAFWTTLLCALTPLFSAGAVIHTPDAALAAACSGTMLLCLHALRSGSARAWAGCGACLGLALLAKLTALTLAAGLALFSLTCPAGRRHLLRPGPVLALLVATLVVAPHLWWNAQHAGGSFAFQLEHALSGGGGPLQALAFLGGQAGVVSPLLWLAAAAFLAVGWRAVVRHGRCEAYLMWCLGAPLLLACFGLSFFSRVEANWPAVAYLPLAGASAWAWTGGAFYPRKRKLLVWSAGLLAAVMALLVHLQALTAWLPLKPHDDASRRLRGWRELARTAESRAHDFSAELAGEGYALVSELRFYTGRNIFYLPAAGRRSQFDVWPREEPPRRSLSLQPAGKGKSPPCSDARPLATPEARDPSFSRLADYRWWLCGSILPGPGEVR